MTRQAGIAVRGYGMGAAVGDYDNDGYLDLFVTGFGADHALSQQRQRHVHRRDEPGRRVRYAVEHERGVRRLRSRRLPGSVRRPLRRFHASPANKQCTDSVGARDYCGPRSYRPVPDRLFRNDGHGRFVDVTERTGIAKADGAGLGVSVGDYNGDGWPDLYVANDATPNQLWINRRDGTFVDEGVISGSALSAAGNPEGSMGIASGDFDLDGDEDLFVTNIAGETSVLYLNDGHGNFEDVRARTGLARLTAAFTGFGTDWFDYDNDGWPDLFIANGAVNIVEAQRGQPSPFRMTNQLFHNLEGRRFEDASALGGPVFARAEISRGAAFGDIDNDGDVDIVFTNNNGPVRLLDQPGRAGNSTGCR